MSKTFLLRKEDVVRRWIHIDAKDVILGKLAVHAAVALMGKDCPTFTPGVDSGAFIVVTNAELVKVTGKKESDKKYRWHTGYIGGLKEKSLEEMRATKPEKVVQLSRKMKVTLRKRTPLISIALLVYFRVYGWSWDQNKYFIAMSRL